LRSGPGRAFAKSQKPTQELVEGQAKGSSKIRNRVEFSALGFFPETSAAQEGPLAVTGPASYRVVLEKATRDFEILYLDARVRVAEFVPSDGRERQLFVFERIAVEEEEEEEEEEDEESRSSSSSSRSAAPSLFSFFVKPSESLATIVEREERASGGGGSGGKKASSAGAETAKRPQPPSFTAPDPAALFEGLMSKVTGEDKDTDLIRSLKSELAAATAAVKEAERAEREAMKNGAFVLRSTAREREELAIAEEAAERAAERAEEIAGEAAERAEELARAVASSKST